MFKYCIIDWPSGTTNPNESRRPSLAKPEGASQRGGDIEVKELAAPLMHYTESAPDEVVMP